MPWDGTLITFNYDLLLDQEQISENEVLSNQYEYFSNLVLDRQRPLPDEATGLFLKMHGSLNWFRCANELCPASSGVQFERDTTRCLNRALGIHIGEESCRYCGSDTVPIIVPPVLRKPIMEDSLLRTIWGQARQKLSSASITASALSSKTSPLGWRLGFFRAFPLVGFVLGSNRPRLASSNLTVDRWGSTTHLCDPAARFHHHGRQAP
jgi:hypothetical protein